ncbi:hypothetical protein K437DRAFT_18187 [Tilletiaria anomala UBC 951]|uniref:Uncharacterized protein n=1 Tax=Tilletiaria anomala (strain ATCC 24038 / CBS 436.72 / UBC 951) TaxID=1037660 RepID=A0A066WP60_TILAU|nr:uncharacterized protein K437DRAFT_18187 [Tilletiaria anomala UBC 951]KDN52385.1 hypothetical protein K437DRAFT_18187 [Tilletiaria anomala UBC 951]
MEINQPSSSTFIGEPSSTPTKSWHRRRLSGNLLIGGPRDEQRDLGPLSDHRPATPASLDNSHHDGFSWYMQPLYYNTPPPSPLSERRTKIRSANSPNLLSFLSPGQDEPMDSPGDSRSSSPGFFTSNAKRFSSLLFSPLFPSPQFSSDQLSSPKPSAPFEVVCLTPYSPSHRGRNPRLIDLTIQAQSPHPDLSDDPFAPDPIAVSASPRAQKRPLTPQARPGSGIFAPFRRDSVLFVPSKAPGSNDRHPTTRHRESRARSKSFSGIPLAWLNNPLLDADLEVLQRGPEIASPTVDPLWQAADDARTLPNINPGSMEHRTSFLGHLSICNQNGHSYEDAEETLRDCGSQATFDMQDFFEDNYWRRRSQRSLEPAWPESLLEHPEERPTELAPALELKHVTDDGRLSIPRTLLYDFDRHERDASQPPIDQLQARDELRTLGSIRRPPIISREALQSICSELLARRQERDAAECLLKKGRTGETLVTLPTRRGVRISNSLPMLFSIANTASAVGPKPPVRGADSQITGRRAVCRKKSFSDLLAGCMSSVKSTTSTRFKD